MEDFLSSFEEPGSKVIMLVMSIPFSLFFAFFQSNLIQHMFRVDLKPRYLLFILYPVGMVCLALLHPGYALLAIVLLFASTVLLFLIGFVKQLFVSTIYLLNSKEATGEKKVPVWKRILSLLAMVACIVLFFTYGPLGFFIILLCVVATQLILPSNKGRFLRFQTVLPTSKIASMAMGLVEVEGKPVAIEKVKKPLNKGNCIGYRYVVEKITVDDGKESYRTVRDETVCNRFYIQDATGRVEVIPDEIELVHFEQDEQHSRGGHRYTQYVLDEGSEVLLVGMADRKEDQPVIRKNELEKVFAIAPSHAISSWNRFKPLRQQAIMYACLIAVFVAFILLADIRVNDEYITVSWTREVFSWDFLTNE